MLKKKPLYNGATIASENDAYVRFNSDVFEEHKNCPFISRLSSVLMLLRMWKLLSIRGTFCLLMVNDEQGEIVRTPCGKI